MTHNRSVVNNLVPTKNRGNSAEFSKNKFHNLRHIIQYLTFVVKKCLRLYDIIIWGCYKSSVIQSKVIRILGIKSRS
jgi:hypothetical protein